MMMSSKQPRLVHLTLSIDTVLFDKPFLARYQHILSMHVIHTFSQYVSINTLSQPLTPNPSQYIRLYVAHTKLDVLLKV